MEKNEDNIKDTIYYWLGKKRPFIVNNEYEIRLLFIDKVNNSAKIEITNLKTKVVTTAEVDND